MARRHVEVPVPALALRQQQAAAALGVSLDVFNAEIRPHITPVRAGGVVVYPVRALEQWLADHAERPVAAQLRSVA